MTPRRGAPPAAFLAATFVSILIPFAARAIPICGDGVCDANAIPAETATSCPEDCGNSSVCSVDYCTSCERPTAGDDMDGDFVYDALEHDLAHAYFPAILLQGAEDDRDESYLFQNRATPYTVNPFVPATESSLCMEPYECLEIRYAIAYFYDAGDTVFGISSHAGDSEFVAVLVQRTTSWTLARTDASAWEMIRDFTAAHWTATGDSSRYGAYGNCPPRCEPFDGDEQACRDHSRFCGWVTGQCFGGSDSQGLPCSFYGDEGSCFFAGGTCEWFGDECLPFEAYACDAGAPHPGFRVYYASEGKHGTYHSQAECDGGGLFGADACPFNLYNLRSFKGMKLQNVGQEWNHVDFDNTILDPDRCNLYSVWGGAKFGASTPWSDHLTHEFGWVLPPPEDEGSGGGGGGRGGGGGGGGGGTDCTNFDTSQCDPLYMCQQQCLIGFSGTIGHECCACMCTGLDACPLCLLQGSAPNEVE